MEDQEPLKMFDVFIPEMTKTAFVSLYQDLLKNDFWSVLVDSEDELYAMLSDMLSVRFARRGVVIPNFEVKFVRRSWANRMANPCLTRER